jgi:CRP/FNR family transcriptional regulator, cyclic AMP receptor protein
MTSGPSIRDEIAGNPFFAGLPSEIIEYLSANAAARPLGRDKVLFHHGEKADHFYVVVSGRISVEVAALQGPPLQLQSLDAGAVLGWSWLIPPYAWTFQARADDDTHVLEFDGSAIRARCDADPRFGYELLKRFSALMSERLEFARGKMMDAWRPSGFA